MELHYLGIPHRLYAEQFLKNAKELVDYKFHCMNGVPQCVLVCGDRKSNGDAAMQVSCRLFDMEWNDIPEIVGKEHKVLTVEKPQYFDRMKQISEILSRDFKFVRVDLYEVDGKIYFGELTFTPASGVFPYYSDKFDREMGKRLQL